MNPLQIRTALVSRIINFRFGAFDRGFETRDVNAQGGDETVTIIPNDDGTVSVQSPNGQQWLSIQEDGSWQARDAKGSPGPWEKFTLTNGNILTEVEKPGITRPLVTFVAGAL